MPSGLVGVDVASFQGTPGQWRAAAGNISWAAVKFTELQPSGTRYVNPDAAADWAYLKQNGLGRVAYMFGHPSQGSAASVAFFASEIATLGLDDGDGICLDHEDNDGIGPSAVSAWADRVMSELRSQYGRAPLLYTDLNFARTGYCAGLGGYPLWISDPSSPEGSPVVPGPWHSWAIHQYGITGAIDRDLAAYPSLAAMRTALGHTPPPPPPPAPELENEMILVQVDRTTVPSGTDWPGVFLVAPGAPPHHVTSTPDNEAYQGAGVKGPAVISYAEYQGWVAGT
jgi:lysozyme